MRTGTKSAKILNTNNTIDTMRVLFTLMIAAFFSINNTVTAQVDFYFFHAGNQATVKNNEIGSGYLYNRTGVTIDVKFEAKVFDENEELVYHVLTKTHSITSGKTVISRAHYKDETPLVNKLDHSKPLLNHRIETSLVHPLDLQSIIAQYNILTKNYIRSTAPEDRYDYFYIIPGEIEINSREGGFSNEGTKLTHFVKMPPKANQYSSSDFTIDLSKSKLLSMKDNLGNEYLNQELELMRDRSNYKRAEAQKGHFMGSSRADHELKNLDIPFMGNRSELASFYTRTFSTPAMATNITSEGYITIIKHTEELLTETIDVNLFDGQRTKTEGINIDWTINGSGGCGDGNSYDVIHPKTALKIKSITFINPMSDLCPTYSDNQFIRVDKDKLPYQAQLEIVYHKPIVKEVYFKNEFNLSLDPYALQASTDHHTEAEISKLIVRKTEDKSKISATFPSPETSTGRIINSCASSVILKNEQGNTIDLGKVVIKDDFFFSNDEFTIDIESLPIKGTRYIMAEVKLAFDHEVEGTEQFIMTISPDEEVETKIDNYIVTFRKNGDRTKLSYFLALKDSNYSCCGIPGRKIISMTVFDDQDVEVGKSEDQSSVVIPDGTKNYKIVIEAQKKETTYESVSKKIALGAMMRSEKH